MDYPRLESAIRRLSHNDVVELLIESALGPIAAGRSPILGVRHPLGFACLPIYRIDPLGACVHIWPRKRQPPRITTSPYHCHSWDLLSYVLHGSVGNQLVEVTEGSTYKAFEVRTKGSTDQLVGIGRWVDAKAMAPEFTDGGAYYELAAGRFHASTVFDGVEAATVVLGSHNPAEADITLGGLDTPDHLIVRRSYSPAETARIAQRLMARLISQPALIAAGA